MTTMFNGRQHLSYAEARHLPQALDEIERYLLATYPDSDPTPERARVIESFVTVLRAGHVLQQQRAAQRAE